MISPPAGTEQRASLYDLSQPGLLLVAVLFLVLQVVVPPTAVNAAGPDTSYPSVTLWPLAYHYEDSSHSRTDILWPIYLRTRSGSHLRTAIRPLLFNYETDPERDFRQLNFIWPLTQFEREKDSFRNWVFPLYYQARNEESTSIQLWPFYGHSLDGKTESWSTIYPLFQYHHNVDTPESEWGIDYFWPLGKSYRRGETSGSYFLPLWWQKSGPGLSGGFVFPYFWRTTEEWQLRGIFPLWFRSRSQDAETDLLIPWFSHRRSNFRFQTLFPVYWQMKRDDGNGFSLLAPVYWSSRGDTERLDIAFPFYFSHENLEYRTRLRYYFPLYGDYRSGDRILHRYYLFPLYARIDDPELQRQAWYFLWPLVHAERTPETFQSWAFPFYWVDRGLRRERTMILALYWASRTPEEEMSFFFPSYYRYRSADAQELHFWPFYGQKINDAYREYSVVWPLFRWGSDPAGDRREWQFLLAYGKKTPEKNIFGFFPLWHHQETDEITRNISLLHWQERRQNGDWQFSLLHAFNPDWSIFTLKKEGDESHNHLLPLYSYSADPAGSAGDRQFSLLYAYNPDWSIFTLRKEGDERHHHFFPLYSYSSNQAGSSKDLWLLGPIYRYESVGADSAKHWLLWKFLYTEKGPGERESGFLWRFVRSKRDDSGSLFELNPFYYSETKSDGESYTSWLGGVYRVMSKTEGNRHRLFWMISW